SSEDSVAEVSLCKQARLEEELLQSVPARDLVKKVLLDKPGGAAVLKEYEDTGSICDSSRRQMVNILAAHMTETEGRVPQRLTREKYALGIITLFPSLKDPLSRKGYEHFYDAQSGSGFLAWRLKTIQRKTKLHSPTPNNPKAMTGGPTCARDIGQGGEQDESCKETISLMTHTNDNDIIFQKMRETFAYRQKLIHSPDTSASVLSVFPRLLDTKGLVLQDFSLLFGSEISTRLLERWPSYKPKLIKEASSLAQTPLLQRLLQSSCQSLDEHLDADDRRQPYLLASGLHKKAISNYYIVMDKKLIPCQGNTSLAAFDELFKVHFVFSLSYDESLHTMFTFLQTTVYNIDVGSTRESPKRFNPAFSFHLSPVRRLPETEASYQVSFNTCLLYYTKQGQTSFRNESVWMLARFSCRCSLSSTLFNQNKLPH
ncbi:uncharacterized protein LOC134436798, partial [Engraulis encrasicolus]|uniref:uncharacterized protein LOC134436798 n=1 Tax=Engraulis encrasicolus TaxID=184585 RepID=UPI002FD30431